MKYQRSALGGSNVAVSGGEDALQTYRRHTVSVPNLGQGVTEKVS